MKMKRINQTPYVAGDYNITQSRTQIIILQTNVTPN